MGTLKRYVDPAATQPLPVLSVPPGPERPEKGCVRGGSPERCKVATQTNNGEVDGRGYVYIVDRANTGVNIREPTGEARKAAGF